MWGEGHICPRGAWRQAQRQSLLYMVAQPRVSVGRLQPWPTATPCPSSSTARTCALPPDRAAGVALQPAPLKRLPPPHLAGRLCVGPGLQQQSHHVGMALVSSRQERRPSSLRKGARARAGARLMMRVRVRPRRRAMCHPRARGAHRGEAQRGAPPPLSTPQDPAVCVRRVVTVCATRLQPHMPNPGSAA